MRVETSNAEVKTLIRLQQMDLIQRMSPLGTTIVFLTDKSTGFFKREDVTVTLLAKALGFTIPDFPFLTDRMPVYLDGPVHRRARIADRDDRIDRMLRSADLGPLRFTYKPPLSNKRLDYICNEIKRNLEMDP